MATALGFGSIQALPDMLADRATRILLVTGDASYDSSGASEELEELLAPYIVTRFKEFSPNPDKSEVIRGCQECLESKAELIVAVGGGSALDMGKLIARFGRSREALSDAENFEVEAAHPALPLIAIPTTSGSGSEATHFAVVYNGKEKFSVAREDMRPGDVIVDPALTRSMSPKLSAVTGLDALAQAIESFWSVDATEESQAHARKALAYLLLHIEGAVRAPTDEAREAMSLGAYWAGRAIDISKTTGAHALSYALTTGHKIPHGHAVALTIGPFMEYNAEVDETDCAHPKGAIYVRNTLQELFTLLGADSASSAHKQWIARMEALGLPSRLKPAGVPSNDFGQLVSAINLERARNNPRRLDADVANQIFTAAAG